MACDMDIDSDVEFVFTESSGLDPTEFLKPSSEVFMRTQERRLWPHQSSAQMIINMFAYISRLSDSSIGCLLLVYLRRLLHPQPSMDAASLSLRIVLNTLVKTVGLLLSSIF